MDSGHYARTVLHTVLVPVFDDACLLDIAGPTEVFATANEISGQALYSVTTRSLGGHHTVRTESGIRLTADGTLAAEGNDVGTLLIPGGAGARPARVGAAGLRRLEEVATRAERVASICTGAFLLAALGLLDGRRATTHWAHAQSLASAAPKCRVVADELFVLDGPVVTSAGVASGIDLALALVEADHNRELARAISRHLVVYLARGGGQSQFSERQSPEPSSTVPLDALLADISAEPGGDHSVAALADSLGISPRHLTRLFRERTGTTPARWVERVRCDYARDRLQSTSEAVEKVSRAAGFASPVTMRQAFHRVYGVPPTSLR